MSGRSADADEATDDHDDYAASAWLKELGIDQSRYRLLYPAKLREYLLLSPLMVTCSVDTNSSQTDC